MNNYMVTMNFYLNAECILQAMVICAENEADAITGACYMARHWWPDYEENCGEWYWSFERGAIEFNEVRLLTDTESAVLSELNVVNFWQVTGVGKDTAIVDLYGHSWR